MVKTRGSTVGICAEARKVTAEQGPRRSRKKRRGTTTTASTSRSAGGPSSSKKAKKMTPADKVSEEIRKEILGQRIARTVQVIMNKNQQQTTTTTTRNDDEDTYCFGKIVSVRRGKDLDEDLYRVSYDDGTAEDLNTLTLFDALSLYAHWAKRHPSTPYYNKSSIRGLLKRLTTKSSRVATFLDSLQTHDFRRVAKYLGGHRGELGRLCFGTVETKHEEDCVLWTVRYECDSSDNVEYMTEEELNKCLRLYEQNKEKDPNPIQPELRKTLYGQYM